MRLPLVKLPIKLPSLSRLLLRQRAVRGPEAGTGGAASPPVEPACPATPTTTEAARATSARIAPRVRFSLRRLFNPSLRRSSRPTPACLLARLENGAEVIYALHGDSEAERVQDVPKDCPLILSVTADDLRLVLPEPMPHAAAKSRLIRETASYAKLGVVSAGLTVYGTPVARIAEARAQGHRLAPLSALADRLALRQRGALPDVTGFVFGEQADGAMAIAVFFAQQSDGKTRAHISVNPDNLQAIYGAFLASLGLPEDTEPAGFNQTEALEGLQGFYAVYPSQDDILGVPARLAWLSALAASAVLCLGAGGWWWMGGQSLDALKSEAAAARTRQAQHVEAIGRAIAGDLPVLSRLVGLSPRDGLADAEALYLPGSHIESEFTAQETRHDVFVPLRLRATDVADEPDAKALAAAFALSRPGCQRTALEYSGALDEVRIRFSCPGGNAAAAPFRGEPGA